MTQQYIVGQFSILLEELQSSSDPWPKLVGKLRQEVESSPPSALPGLAAETIDLAETICWSALEQGEVSLFYRCAKTAAALAIFIDAAHLDSD